MWYDDKEKVSVIVRQVKIAAAASVVFCSLDGDFMSLHFVII